MKITVNGEEKALEPGTTVRQLIQSLGLDQRPVAVEVNRELVPKALHEQTALQDGDHVEMVTLVGGG